MNKIAKKKSKSILPINIKLPERILLENRTMFVVLKTPSELEEFWNKNNNRYEFYCNGNSKVDAMFLNSNEWVFGNSKSAIVHTVLRWGKSNIGCEYYDMAVSDPQFFKSILRNSATYRLSQIKKGEWTENDEALHVKKCARYANESTRGRWKLVDFLNLINPDDWFSGIDSDIIFDRNMPIIQVARILHEQAFNEWMNSNGFEVYAGKTNSLFSYIEAWKEEEESCDEDNKL